MTATNAFVLPTGAYGEPLPPAVEVPVYRADSDYPSEMPPAEHAWQRRDDSYWMAVPIQQTSITGWTQIGGDTVIPKATDDLILAELRAIRAELQRMNAPFVVNHYGVTTGGRDR